MVEMIIVVAIIVVLLGFLAPLIATIEARRRRLGCATNLHQVSAGVISYALDNSGALPAHFGGRTLHLASSKRSLGAASIVYARETASPPRTQ